jgi:hypothetical protein
MGQAAKFAQAFTFGFRFDLVVEPAAGVDRALCSTAILEGESKGSMDNVVA